MDSTTTDLLLVAALLGGIVLFALGMLGVALRFGPRRGSWNQPAAALRRPGRYTFAGMYALAALHVMLGLIVAISVPGAGLGVLVVTVAMAGFYVLCAHGFALATSIQHRRQR